MNISSPFQKNRLETPVTWLRMTEYMHDWLNKSFGGKCALYGKPILSVAHLPGAYKALQMEVFDDMQDVAPLQAGQAELKDVLSLSAMRMDCLQHGCRISPDTVDRLCGLTQEQLGAFVPLECPRMAMTAFGVLRPWNRTMAFSRAQSNELIRLLRGAFWQAVADHESQLREKGALPDTAIELIESFCRDTGMSELWVEDMRRQWQRYLSRRKG